MPKISVAMAVYNGERFLREQLDSVYAQTIAPFEVIAVDDCSSDNSFVILKEYAQKHGLKYMQNKQNLGANKTFEKAIFLSSGDFIAPCDQDDIWAENKLEECHKAILDLPIDEPNTVICSSIYMDENKKTIYKDISKRKIYRFQDFFPYSYVAGACSLFNSALKDKVIPFRTAMNYDAELAMIADLIGNRIQISTTWRFFRLHFDNLTSALRNRGFMGKQRFRIHHCLYKNHLRKKWLDCYMEVIEKYELNVESGKMEFIAKLQNAVQKRYKIFFVKEFSFAKRIKIFVAFYIYDFVLILKGAR